ncbi:hypothetical protein [Streptomyces phaeochromogenes]|uniref:hypothetical protein n=1 Tax=Streptomyces phaeochromogenes TaxID=1923 RepID=UPI0036B7B820
MDGYEFGLLGPLIGRHDGRELDLGSPLQRAVLVRLPLGEGRRWGFEDPTSSDPGVAPGSDRAEVNPSVVRHVYEVNDRLRREAAKR